MPTHCCGLTRDLSAGRTSTYMFFGRRLYASTHNVATLRSSVESSAGHAPALKSTLRVSISSSIKYLHARPKCNRERTHDSTAHHTNKQRACVVVSSFQCADLLHQSTINILITFPRKDFQHCYPKRENLGSFSELSGAHVPGHTDPNVNILSLTTSVEPCTKR